MLSALRKSYILLPSLGLGTSCLSSVPKQNSKDNNLRNQHRNRHRDPMRVGTANLEGFLLQCYCGQG